MHIKTNILRNPRTHFGKKISLCFLSYQVNLWDLFVVDIIQSRPNPWVVVLLSHNFFVWVEFRPEIYSFSVRISFPYYVELLNYLASLLFNHLFLTLQDLQLGAISVSIGSRCAVS